MENKKYQNGKIYCIECKISGKKYIGSTCQTLKERLRQHIKAFKRWKQQEHHYVSSFDVIENGDFEISLLESCVCDSKIELEKRERYWVEIIENRSNRKIPTRTKQEFMKLYDKHRYQEKKDYYLEKNHKFNEQNPNYFKERYSSNREKILQQQKEWNKENKDKVKTYYDRYYEKPYECECGSKMKMGNKSQHLKSKKHQRWLNK